ERATKRTREEKTTVETNRRERNEETWHTKEGTREGENERAREITGTRRRYVFCFFSFSFLQNFANHIQTIPVCTSRATSSVAINPSSRLSLPAREWR
ncbi:hypothetical protein ALC56_13705, partial [Trachymyrmex septentrionalis]